MAGTVSLATFTTRQRPLLPRTWTGPVSLSRWPFQNLVALASAASVGGKPTEKLGAEATMPGGYDGKLLVRPWTVAPQRLLVRTVV